MLDVAAFDCLLCAASATTAKSLLTHLSCAQSEHSFMLFISDGGETSPSFIHDSRIVSRLFEGFKVESGLF